MKNRKDIPLKKGIVWYEPNYLSDSDCEALWAELTHEIPWRQEPIWMFGKQVMQPRLTCWVGRPEAKIRYSGIEMLPEPFTPLLHDLHERLCHELQTDFNGVLLNYYRDGRDSMGWHADDEAYQGPQPTVASISLGATRTFQLRPKIAETDSTHSLSLENGSLLVMAGDTQTYYKHQIPKTTKTTEPRINLTFRRIVG